MKCIIILVVLIVGTNAFAEQKLVFAVSSIKYKSGTSTYSCESKCKELSSSINDEIAAEWRIVASSPKELIAMEYWETPNCNVCQPHGCTCIGTEYVLEKVEEAEETVPTKPKKKKPSNK
jgi:hypothetical protein